ncbi:MAG: MBL fold metallo-hydrolase [Pseudomonadota bacterium]
MNLPKITLIPSLMLLLSCSINPHYDAKKPHHTKSGFKNIYYEDDKGFREFVQWRWERLFKDLPNAEDYHFTIDTKHHDFIVSNRDKPTLTWIGHATFLIQLHGLNILTDPQFSERASPVSWAGPKRVIPPAPALDKLPDIDAVIISHDHYDSLDRASVLALSKHNRRRQLTFVVPLGMKSWFERLNLDSTQVIELDWAQSHKINDITFTAEPSQHWSKRSLFDTFKRLWVSWVIDAPGARIFFAGDTGYAQHFKDIGNKYGCFDLALLPIGGYEPRWFMQPFHVNPEEVVKIHRDINSRYSVAMHWGTFILTDEPLDEPPRKLAEALEKYNIPPSTFETYRYGETRFLDQLFTKPTN